MANGKIRGNAWHPAQITAVGRTPGPTLTDPAATSDHLEYYLIPASLTAKLFHLPTSQHQHPPPSCQSSFQLLRPSSPISSSIINLNNNSLGGSNSWGCGRELAPSPRRPLRGEAALSADRRLDALHSSVGFLFTGARQQMALKVLGLRLWVTLGGRNISRLLSTSHLFFIALAGLLATRRRRSNRHLPPSRDTSSLSCVCLVVLLSVCFAYFGRQ